MKSYLLAAGAALLLVGCATTGEDAGPPAAATAANGMPIVAPAYMEMAASGDLFEIQSSQLALQRSNNGALRSFAQMLINDHTRLSNEMMSAATAAGLAPPPPQMLPMHAEMLQRLQAAGPGDFDVAFRTEQIAAHQQALMLHQTYAAEGDVPALRTVASAAVPAIQAHLSQVQALPAQAMMPPPEPMTPAPDPARRAGERG
jgi:putative membrane protein